MNAEARKCGNCACWDKVNELLGNCTGDILKTGHPIDGRDAAADCPFWRPRDPEVHTRYRRLEADYYADSQEPICICAHAVDGHVYVTSGTEVKRCRCAKWTAEIYRYSENDIAYRRETWTGPGAGIALVTTENMRIR